MYFSTFSQEKYLVLFSIVQKKYYFYLLINKVLLYSTFSIFSIKKYLILIYSEKYLVFFLLKSIST